MDSTLATSSTLESEPYRILAENNTKPSAILALHVWSSFLAKYHPTKPDQIPAIMWDRWLAGAECPAARFWPVACKKNNFDFARLLQCVATLDSASSSFPCEIPRKIELSWRRSVLRSYYGKVDSVYYPLLNYRTAMNSAGESAPAPEYHADLDHRERKEEITLLRLRKWNDLREKFRITKVGLPTELANKGMRPNTWFKVCSGTAYPALKVAGLVAAVFRVPYDEMFEVYCYGELPGISITHPTYKQSLLNMRGTFNKSGWPEAVLKNPMRVMERKTRQRDGMMMSHTVRRARFLEAYDAAARRASEFLKSGDTARAGMARIEAKHYAARLVGMGAPNPMQEAPVVAAPPPGTVQAINPATGVAEWVQPSVARKYIEQVAIQSHPIVTRDEAVDPLDLAAFRTMQATPALPALPAAHPTPALPATPTPQAAPVLPPPPPPPTTPPPPPPPINPDTAWYTQPDPNAHRPKMKCKFEDPNWVPASLSPDRPGPRELQQVRANHPEELHKAIHKAFVDSTSDYPLPPPPEPPQLGILEL